MSNIGTTKHEIELLMRQMRCNWSAVLSFLAVNLTVLAAHSATDQSRDLEFEKETAAYIKQYALPQMPLTSRNELLFSKRALKTRPGVATVTPIANTPASSSPPPPPNPAPESPATEPSHE